jgi:xylulokinase
MYFTHPEITPHNRQGEYRFNKSGERVARFASKEAEVRALVEGQFMAKRIHAEKMGFKIGL